MDVIQSDFELDNESGVRTRQHHLQMVTASLGMWLGPITQTHRTSPQVQFEGNKINWRQARPVVSGEGQE